MKQFVMAMAIVSSLILDGGPRAASWGAEHEAQQTGRPQTRPLGWSEFQSKTRDLLREGKELEALARYETWVAKHPDFGEGQMWLGAAHEAVARRMTSRGPDAQTRMNHLEAAAVHMRRGIDLGGEFASSFEAMRSLIDLHDGGWLNRPTEYERLVREGVTRFPTDPIARAYLLELLATKGEPIETAARVALPNGHAARVELASALVAKVRYPSRLTPPPAAVLLSEASRLIDEALKLKPDDAGALDVRRAIQSLQSNSSRLPLAQEVVVRGDLLSIRIAQEMYFHDCANGHYAPTLAVLARPAAGKKEGFLQGHLVPAGGATVLERFGYRIEMTAVPTPKSPASCNGVPAGGSAETYSVRARPMEGFHGRAFRMGPDGKLVEIK